MSGARYILYGVCGLLGLAALAPWFDGVSPGVLTLDSGANNPVKLDSRYNFNDPLDLDAYAEILRRPLFLAARRPATAPDAGNSTGNEPLLLGRYQVAGIVIAGQRRIVLLRQASSDKVSRFEQGAALDGWTLAEVSRQRLVLEKAGQRQEFILKQAGAGED